MAKPKLNPFQFVGAYKLFTEERFLLADDMGMYKTSQAIFANSKFREKKRGRLRTLVVCPTSVREHWAREIQQWAYPRPSGQDVNILSTTSLDTNVHSAKSSDWTIMHYPLASRLDNEVVQKLLRTGFHHVILDEVHNAKNPYSIRTRVVKGLADQADYVSLLSGTPIPNTIADLYTLMSLLDPEEYPLDPENLEVARQTFIQLYLNQPQAVKELFHRRMLARKAEDYIGEKLPQLNIHRVPIPLQGLHLDEYLKLLEQDIHAGRKIMALEKISIDPRLVNESLPRQRKGTDVSMKYAFLDEVVEREMKRRTGKVVVFSALKTGIINDLVERYSEHGTIKITGDIDATVGGQREELRGQFQHDPKTRILFATTTMHEGVDLTAATAIVNLTIPWTPAEYYQRYKRSHRNGEIKKEAVDVYTPYVTIPGPQLSLEEASLQMLDGKEAVVKYLMSGIQVSKEELMELEEPGRVPRIRRAIKSPNKAVFEYFLRWRGLGSGAATRRLHKAHSMAHYIAELYPSFSMARNAADIYVPVIKELEKRRKLDPKVDLASGPGMLGYFLDEPTVAVDINPEMLRVGRRMYPQNKLIQGSMDAIPLVSNHAGLVVCSLAYQMTAPKEERARALQEISRVLKPNGYAIITLPPRYLRGGDYHKFDWAIGAYGFTVKDHRRDLGPSQLEIYVLQRTHGCEDKIYNLRFYGDPGAKEK